MTAPSFLDWVKIDTFLHDNKFDSSHIYSKKCVLPTYGYPEQAFIENFQNIFNGGYYDINNSGPTYWVSKEKNKIEFRVKTICGFKAK